MPRTLLATALLVVVPAVAGAQTAGTDTAPVRPAKALVWAGNAQAPDAAPAAALTDAEIARRLAHFYDRQSALLQADADGDPARFAVLLDALVADVQTMSQRSGSLSDSRFRALYTSVLTEYERFYDRPALDRGEVYAVREAGISAIERGFDAGAPLLEHVTLPDVATFETVFPMDVNPKVERYVQFLINRPSHVQKLRSRADTYFPMIERVLAEEGVPDEIKYLAMVESALVPVAQSHMAAAGLWQFIRATGRAYGLRAESDVDDRLDPEMATRAAARHLRDLYDRFGDWQLALAGYNCNPAVIARAVKRFEERTGRRATFWDIDSAIPRETRAYVPMFIATSLVVSNPDAYGFPAYEPGPSYVFDRVPVAGGTSLASVGRIIDVDVEVLRALNPSLRRNQVPDVRVPHMLRVPAGSYAEHAERLDRLAPPEARGDQFAAATVSFGPRAVRPIAPQEHGEAMAALTVRRETARSLQPQRRVRRDAPVPHYAASTPADVADAEARYAVSVQADRARRDREEAEAEAAPEVLLASRAEPAEGRPARAVRQPATEPDDAEEARVAEEDVEIEAAAPAPARRAPVRVAPAPRAPAPAPPSAAPPVPVRVVSSVSERTTTHRVQRGEYLTSIGRQYGLSLEQIRDLNPGVGDNLAVGQLVTVIGTPTAPTARAAAPTAPVAPSRPSTHTVQRGDHLTNIATRYGLSVSDLREWNGLSSDVIRVGQRLRLRARGSRG